LQKYVILLGAPACGKGTQCNLLVNKYGFKQFSTGDMLRAAVTEGTELGLKADTLMKAGKLVDDDLVISIIKDNLVKYKNDSILFDGFPRTIPQAEKLDQMLKADGKSIDFVVNIKVDDSILVERVIGRRIHKASGRS